MKVFFWGVFFKIAYTINFLSFNKKTLVGRSLSETGKRLLMDKCLVFKTDVFLFFKLVYGSNQSRINTSHRCWASGFDNKFHTNKYITESEVYISMKINTNNNNIINIFQSTDLSIVM